MREQAGKVRPSLPACAVALSLAASSFSSCRSCLFAASSQLFASIGLPFGHSAQVGVECEGQLTVEGSRPLGGGRPYPGSSAASTKAVVARAHRRAEKMSWRGVTPVVQAFPSEANAYPKLPAP